MKNCIRKDDYSLLKNALETKELPEYYTYYLDKRRKNLTLVLSEKGNRIIRLKAGHLY